MCRALLELSYSLYINALRQRERLWQHTESIGTTSGYRSSGSFSCFLFRIIRSLRPSLLFLHQIPKSAHDCTRTSVPRSKIG